jgi:hypothetical protein
MYLDIEFLTSLAGTGEYGLPIGGGRIFDNDRNDQFLVRCRDFFNDAGHRGTASKAIRLRRFKDERMIFMIFRGKFASRLRIDCVEKVKRKLQLCQTNLPGHLSVASIHGLNVFAFPCGRRLSGQITPSLSTDQDASFGISVAWELNSESDPQHRNKRNARPRISTDNQRKVTLILLTK